MPVIIDPVIIIEDPHPADPTDLTDPYDGGQVSQDWEQFSSFSSRFRSSYTMALSSYAIGGTVSIPLTGLDRSELLLRTGISALFKGREYYEGEKMTSLFVPLAIAVRTDHYVDMLSNAEFTLYSTFGGGPALGMIVPQNSDEVESEAGTHFSAAGELFGSIGAEMALRNGQGVCFELGVSYLGFAGTTMSDRTSFISPTLSIGIRFH